MNRIVDFFKKYLIIISILLSLAIVLSMSYSNFIVTSGKHKAAEMYIGTLKYSMTIDGTTKNTLSVPTGETIVDITITNENPIDTYYKLIYQNNSNVSIKYYESTKDTNDKVTNYSSPNSKITSNNKNTIKLKIVNNADEVILIDLISGFIYILISWVILGFKYSMRKSKNMINNLYSVLFSDEKREKIKALCDEYNITCKFPRVTKLVDFINSASKKFRVPQKNEFNLLYINWSYSDFPSNGFIEAWSLLTNELNGIITHPEIGTKLPFKKPICPEAYKKITAIIVYTSSLDQLMFTNFQHVWQ